MSEFFVVLVCLFFNMLLAGSEMAFVTVNKQQLKRMAASSRSARVLLKLKEHPERTLSVIQIGITLVGAIAAAVGGAGAGEELMPYLMAEHGLSEHTAEILAIALVVLPISYLNVVVGELVPKTIALRNPLTISVWAAQGLYVAQKLLAPAVAALEFSTNLILKALKMKAGKSSADPHDIELEDLPHHTKQYVFNLVNADKTEAREVMLNWKDVIYVNRTATTAEVEHVVLSSRHTRLPVMADGEVVGLINTKEFLATHKDMGAEWQGIIRPIIRFKSFETLFKILLKMQEQQSHMAVIYDRQTVAGILTMEDIFEEIIGDIFDEDDDGLIKKILAAKSRRRPI